MSLDFLPKQLINIICSLLDDTVDNINIKKNLQCAGYPFYTTIRITSPKRIEKRCNGLLHSRNDETAIICSNGDQQWYKDGLLHRDDDKPAIIYGSGDKSWYRNGDLHRDNDKPAIINDDGGKYGIKMEKYIGIITNPLILIMVLKNGC